MASEARGRSAVRAQFMQNFAARIAELPPKDREATVVVAGLPLEFARDRIWLQSVSSSLYAGFVLARTDGAITLRDIDPAAGRAVFRLRWNPVE